jgi:transposase
MRLSKHDLFQMDDEWLKKLPAELLLEVSKRLLQDVKELQDQLNKNPGNSSRPPSTKAPWEKAREPGVENEAPVEGGAGETAESSAPAPETTPPAPETSPPVTERPSPREDSGKRPGKQAGSPGHGRTQKLAVTDHCAHRPESCAACGAAWRRMPSRRLTRPGTRSTSRRQSRADRADVQRHASHAA